MFGKALMRGLSAAVVASAAVAQAGLTIDLVPVGNPGNGSDTTGYGRVAVPYQIGKYEITSAQYVEFLNAVAKTDTYGLYSPKMGSFIDCCNIQQSGSSGSYDYSVADDWASRPVNYVSFWNAARFANWLHNGQPTGEEGLGTTEDGAYLNIGDQYKFARQPGAKYFIPTENEWYKAAYHKNDGVTSNYFDYATSSDSVPSNALIDPDPGNNANFKQNNLYTSPYGTTVVGEFENSESPYGTFDQSGNVKEWNEAVINLMSSSYRGVRGGVWIDPASSGLAASYRSYRLPTDGSYAIGFRVASVPEPGSITLLVAGAIAGLMWWRRRR